MVQTLDGIEDGPWTPAAAGERRPATPPRSPSRTPRSTGPPRRRDPPADPGRATRRRAPGPRSAASGSRSTRPSRPRPPDAGCPGDHQAHRRRRHRHRALRLGEVQPPGKRPMPAADWARGVAFGPRSGWLGAERRVRGAGAGPPAAAPDRARRLAFDALRRVTGDGAYANLAAAELLAERRLDSRDAAFAWSCWPEPAAGWAPTTASSRRPPVASTTSVQPAVLDLLRLGHPPDPGDAGAGPGRRGGHRRPGRGHGRGAGHRTGQRRPAEGGRRRTWPAGSTG